MSETPKKGVAVPSIDAVLRDWPEAEKSASEWDERAESVMGRLKRGERGATAAYVSNDDLFSDPLGHSEEDGHNGSAPGSPVIHSPATPRTREGKMQSSDRERDRKSLQDLAKMAQGLTPPPSSVAVPFSAIPSSRSVANLGAAKADDSGIVDLAAASAADPHAAMRAQSTPLASHSLYEDVPAPPPPNAPPPAHAYQQPAPSVPPPSVAPSVPPAAYGSISPIGPSLAKKKSGSGGVVFAIGGLLAISAAAAGGFLYIRGHHAAATTAASQPAATQPAAPVVVADNSKPADPAAKTPDSKPADGAFDPNALPTTDSSSGKVAGRHHRNGGRVAKAEAPEADEAPAAPAAKPSDKPAAFLAQSEDAKPATAAPAAPAGAPGDLGAAMQGAVGPRDQKQEQKPAAAATMGNVPQKPSQGAVTGALGAVLPGARDCLGPDDPISKASVVFNSDGSVYSVTVSGAAQGKPAATCIEKEMKKAKLQPFAEPSYTANVTIRHN